MTMKGLRLEGLVLLLTVTTNLMREEIPKQETEIEPEPVKESVKKINKSKISSPASTPTIKKQEAGNGRKIKSI